MKGFSFLSRALQVRRLAVFIVLAAAVLLFGMGSADAAGIDDIALLSVEPIRIFHSTAPVGGQQVVRVVPVSGAPDTQVNVMIQIEAQGGETAVSYTLNFDQTRLSISGVSGTNNNPDVISGADTPFSTRTVNATQLASGRIGLLQSFNGSLTAGTRHVLTFRFRILPGATGSVNLTFGNVPVERSMTNELAESIDATYTGGAVTVTAASAGSLQFASASTTVAEGAGTALFTVNRVGGTSGAVSVQYATTNQTATGGASCSAGTDYVTTSGVLNFANGQTSATISVPVCDDAIVEASETAAIALSNPGGGAGLGSPTSATLTITDNDVLPSVSVSVAPSSVTEDGAANLVYTFTRSADTGPLSVNFSATGTASAPSDYTLSGATFGGTTGVVNFATGTTVTVTVDPTADSTVESDETVTLNVTAGSGYTIGSPSAATGTISNDDVLPSVSVTAAPASLPEDGPGNVVFTFARTGSTTGALTVGFTIAGTAVNGSDYTCLAGTGAAALSCSGGTGQLTLAAGTSTAQVLADPTPDLAIEPDENLVFTIAAGAGYAVGNPNSAAATITNDDFLPSVTVTVSPSAVAEDGVSNLVYTFSRSGSTAGPIDISFTLSGSASFGSDYACLPGAGATGLSCSAGGGQMTLNAGVSSGQLIIDPVLDTAVETDETVVVGVAAAAGYSVGNPGTASGTISNDDSAPAVAIVVTPASVVENGSANLVFTFLRTGPTASGLTVQFTLGGTASLGSDYSCQPGTGAAAVTCAATGQIAFAAGSSSAQLIVDPTQDTAPESDETVDISVAAGPAYVVGSPNSAVGTIVEPSNAGLEADLAGRPTGDGLLRSNDVEAARAIISGDPVNTTTNEFQRADVAPYETQGDGLLRANDLQLVKNYVAALVAPQPAGGPGIAQEFVLNERPVADGRERVMRIVSAQAEAGRRVSVTIEVDALGDEMVSLFSLAFDPAILSNPVVTLADGASRSAAITVNARNADKGQLKILVDAGDALLPQTSSRLIVVTFNTAKDAVPGETPISFQESGSFSDQFGRSLGASYVDGAVTILPRVRGAR